MPGPTFGCQPRVEYVTLKFSKMSTGVAADLFPGSEELRDAARGPDCMTTYPSRMTLLSFRVEEPDAAAVQTWAERLGIDRSELLRDALRRHLLRLASEQDAATWQSSPLTADEQSLTDIADWGPAEDWADWADAAR